MVRSAGFGEDLLGDIVGGVCHTLDDRERCPFQRRAHLSQCSEIEGMP